MLNITQKSIAKEFGVSQPFISQLLVGQKKISWPLAEKLSTLFPRKSISEWKRATSQELKEAFNQLEKGTCLNGK